MRTIKQWVLFWKKDRSDNSYDITTLAMCSQIGKKAQKGKCRHVHLFAMEMKYEPFYQLGKCSFG